MPLYEYECENCGTRFEVIQRFSDSPIETCRSCGGPVHKLLSPPAIQFKGTGWYITDYAKKNGSSPSHPYPHSSSSVEKTESAPAAPATPAPAASASSDTGSAAKKD